MRSRGLLTAAVCSKEGALITTLIILAAVPEALQLCRMGWLQYKSHCYLLVTDQVTMNEAQDSCADLNGNLAVVNSPGERMFLWSQLSRASCLNVHPNAAQCYEWARAGMCARNRPWMTAFCQAACGRCGIGCADRYAEEWCQFWHARGMCRKQKHEEEAWAGEYCAKTCRRCLPGRMRGYWVGWGKKVAGLAVLRTSNKTSDNCTRMDPATGEWLFTPCDEPASGYACVDGKASVVEEEMARCKPQGTSYGGHCYVAFGKKTSMTTWVDANRTCQREAKRIHAAAKGIRLATLPDVPTAAFVASQLSGATPCWIGLSSQDSDGGKAKYSWADGRPMTFQLWSHENETGTGTGDGKKKCVAMRPDHSGSLRSWRALDCDERKGVMCEYERPARAAPSCSQGWERHDGSCLRYFDRVVGCLTAERNCHELGATLPVVHSEEAMKAMDLVGYKVLWLGLKRVPDAAKSAKGHVYRWADGKDFTTKDCAYCPWGPGQPDGKGECVLFNKSLWFEAGCQTVSPYVCSRSSEKAPSCALPGWEWHGGYCYLVIRDFHDDDDNDDDDDNSSGSTWHEARDFCNVFSGELVSLWTRREVEFVRSKMQSAAEGGGEKKEGAEKKKKKYKYWIGLVNEEPVYWVDGSPFTLNMTSSPGPEARRGEGGEGRDEEDQCFYMDLESDGWSKASCRSSFAFVCKSLGPDGYPRPKLALPARFFWNGPTGPDGDQRLPGRPILHWDVGLDFLPAFLVYVIVWCVLTVLACLLLRSRSRSGGTEGAATHPPEHEEPPPPPQETHKE